VAFVTRSIGGLLVAGFVTFLVGAAFWRPATYQGPLPLALTAMAEEPGRMRWIQSWMIVGVVLTTLGVVMLARWLGARGQVTASTLGASLFGIGSMAMLLSLTFGLTVRIWAAAETASTGQVPFGFEALHRWATLLYAIHMVAAYLAWALLGVALLRCGAAPAWLGASGIGAGCLLAIGFVAFGGGPFGPPILAHVYPLVIGTTFLVRGCVESPT
jgi:hypothetical protein